MILSPENVGVGQLPSVLVVEDEVLILIATAQEFRDAGFDVYEASNAAQAVRMLEAHPDIGVLFTDVDMPGALDGLMLSTLVRDRWPPVKIIVTSGKSLAGRTAMPSNGVFISKPYDLRRVLATTREMLS